jgi:hypothetical protein
MSPAFVSEPLNFRVPIPIHYSHDLLRHPIAIGSCKGFFPGFATDTRMFKQGFRFFPVYFVQLELNGLIKKAFVSLHHYYKFV